MDAPIELVIAIIVLVASLSLAFFVIQQSETGRCIASLKTQVQHLQQAILDVGLGSAGTKKTVRFDMPRCGDKTVEGLQFVNFKKAEFCRACPGNFNGCWQIIPLARTSQGLVQLREAATCIDLPSERISINPAPQTSGSACQRLSDSPCPAGNNCLSDLGISQSLVDRDNAIWQTFTREGSTHYVIDLRKYVSSRGTNVENSEIQLCAQTAESIRNANP
ncbi:MAG: hypothetical protein Q8P02_03150 [Candidatus Micrarchaeota archaeon]|nr:hypothetical protein [Candidatus Micrarchaeota archaeon]